MRGARVISFAIGIVVIAAFLSGLALWRAAAEDFGSLDGTWEGDLKSVDLTGEGKATTSWRRIIIQDGQARVFYKRDEKINEVKPGNFESKDSLQTQLLSPSIQVMTMRVCGWKLGHLLSPKRTKIRLLRISCDKRTISICRCQLATANSPLSQPVNSRASS